MQMLKKSLSLIVTIVIDKYLVRLVDSCIIIIVRSMRYQARHIKHKLEKSIVKKFIRSYFLLVAILLCI